MALKLNRPEDVVTIDGKKFPLFREFYGQNIAQMPKLNEAGRTPISTARLMQRRLELRKAPEDVKSAWTDNYFDTGDAVAYHPDGRMKVDLDSAQLRQITPESQRVGGAIALTEDLYNAIDAEEFTRAELEGHIGNQLTREQAKANPVWRVLARDQALLNDYVDHVFTEGKQRFGYDEAMGVFPDSAGDTPKLRAWCVGRLGYGSDASGGDDLGIDDGRFVGLAPEAQIALGSSPQRVQKYTMADVHAVETQLAEIERFAKPEVTKPIRSLVDSL
ncbi:MAG: hypothetical protein KJ718_00970 [Nanoarchaeota archaeon]|nr:hypothetical protein [Nanoarchaeota archaeon]